MFGNSSFSARGIIFLGSNLAGILIYYWTKDFTTSLENLDKHGKAQDSPSRKYSFKESAEHPYAGSRRAAIAFLSDERSNIKVQPLRRVKYKYELWTFT